MENLLPDLGNADEADKLINRKLSRVIRQYNGFKKKNVQHFKFNSSAWMSMFGKLSSSSMKVNNRM